MNKHRNTFLASVVFNALRVIAFDPGKEGWKMSADGKTVETKDGNPIWVDANGGESVMEHATISRLNGEAGTLRKRAEKAEAIAEKFKGIDPEKAAKAIETVSKIDAKTLIDAGEVDKVKDEIGKQYQGQIAEKDKVIGDLTTTRDNLIKSNAFASSEFIKTQIAVPAEMFEATFAKNFKVEDGKIVPYGLDGNKIYSPTRMAETATVDEAFAVLLKDHPHKDMILKAPEHRGSGNGGGGGNRDGKRVMLRADYDKLGPMEKVTTAEKAAKGEITLVDN